MVEISIIPDTNYRFKPNSDFTLEDFSEFLTVINVGVNEEMYNKFSSSLKKHFKKEAPANETTS